MPSTNEPVELGNALLRHRKKLGLTQKQAAARLNVDQPTWHRWEAGRRPRQDFFDRLAEFLEVSREQVVLLAHEPAQPDELEELVAAMGSRWADLKPEDRARLAQRIRGLLDED